MYHYAGNNPVKYTDPTGEVAETAWDIFSLASGVASFVANVKQGNAKGAIIDALGIVADATAVALPCIPGGAGAAIKAARATGAVSNIAGGALTIQDGIENNNNLEVGIGLLQIVSGSGQLKSIGTSKTASIFFEGTSYSDKVKYQMSQGVGELHSFPEEVINFSSEGKIEKIIGNDGKSYTKLSIAGTYNGKSGNFEFIKDSNGTINHSFFKVDEY